MPFVADGNWYVARREPEPVSRPRPALFLDRDGVVIEDRNYIRDPGDVSLIPGVVQTLRRFRDAGFPVVVITNQSGIGRGMFGWPEFFSVQSRLEALLDDQGISLDMVLACPFHPRGDQRDDNSWRKPNSGMISFAASLLGIDLPGSVLVGDKLSDIQAGATGGVGSLAHVLTGHGATERRLVAARFPESRMIDSLADLNVPE